MTVPPAIRRVAEAGIQAPSVGNSQPWRFLWNGTELEIHTVPERADSFLNFAGVETWLALGAVLEDMSLRARDMGLELQIEENAPKSPAARVRVVSEKPSPASQAVAWERRHTNRRPYRIEPVPEDLRLSLFRAAESGGVRLAWIEDRGDLSEAASALGSFDRALLEHPDVARSVFRWIRWSAREAARGDGLPLPTLELDAVARTLLHLTRISPFARLMGSLGVGRVAARLSGRLLRRSAALGIFFVDRWEPQAILQAGRAFERLWLTAANAGWSLHPLSGLTLLDLRCRFAGGEGLGRNQRDWIARSGRDLARVCPEWRDRIPVVAFRFGRGEAPTAVSGRRPLKEVLRSGPSEERRNVSP